MNNNSLAENFELTNTGRKSYGFSVIAHQRILSDDIDSFNKMLSNFCSGNNFMDDVWFIDLIRKEENVSDKIRKIIFNINNDEAKYELKKYALYALLSHHKPRTILEKVKNIIRIYNCSKCSKAFKDLDKKDVYNLYFTIWSNNKCSERTKACYWSDIKCFLQTMEYFEVLEYACALVAPSISAPEKHDSKYIPDYVMDQYDKLFFVGDVPPTQKAIYWTCRLISNRLTEALSMKANCLKQINHDTYVISIPTFKQEGSSLLPSVKMIELKYRGIGAFYIDLIIEQQTLLKKYNKEQDGYLFYTENWNYVKKEKRYKKVKTSDVHLVKYDAFWLFLKNIGTVNEITDKNGKLALLAPHSFRHNAITDRLESGLFRPIDLVPMTGHHNTVMIEQAYSHQKLETAIPQTPIIFKGRIVNFDNKRKVERILANPYARRIHGLGICFDSRSCSKGRSACYRCDYLIPNADELDSYIQEREDWKIKREKAIQGNNDSYAELCSEWIESCNCIINKIINSLPKEDEKC